METENESRAFWTSDEGVSPVIAVIMLVTISLLLAASVYLWVSGFTGEPEDHERASAFAQGVDLDEDGDVQWVKLTLTSGESSPYDGEEVTVSVTESAGADVSELCRSADPATGSCSSPFDTSEASSDIWGVGDNLWIPCKGQGNHLLTVSVASTVILDTKVECDAGA